MTKSRRNYLLALALAYAAFALIYAAFGYERTWKLWNLPFGYPPFMDARVITAGAIAHRAGLDPMVNNPGDVVQRKLNYPRIWQGLYRLGVNEHHGLWLGLVLVGAFAMGMAVFVREPGGLTTTLLLAGLFSPAVMLGVERGNTDLLMFFLVAAAVAASARGTWVALALVMLAFVLKLFPLAALALLLGRPRDEALKAIGIGAALAVLYLLFSYADLQAIRAGTPEGAWIAYGKDVVRLRMEFERHAWAGTASLLAWLVAVLALAGGAIAMVRGGGARWSAKTETNLAAFRAGAACYLGTFLLGSNFDYRLMFLLFTVPQLVEWGRAGMRLRWVPRAMLVAMLAAMWALAIERATGSPDLALAGFVVGEVAAWLMLVAFVYLFAKSLPDWVAVRRAGRVVAKGAAAGAMAPTR